MYMVAELHTGIAWIFLSTRINLHLYGYMIDLVPLLMRLICKQIPGCLLGLC